jgi:O-antigen/teichoic acid export membrane protein
MSAMTPPTAPASHSGEEVPVGPRIVRGAAAIIVSQLLGAPFSFLVNAVLGRRLGPSSFGAIYLGQTAVSLGFLVVDWGQTTAVAATVARDRSLAERVLGTSILLKLGLGTLVTVLLFSLALLEGYSPAEREAVVLLAIAGLAGAVQASGTAVLLGLGRTEQVVALGLAGNVVSSLLVMAFALVGGGLTGVLWAIAAGAALQLIPTALQLRHNGVGFPRLERGRARILVSQGSAFLSFNLVLALQPYIDGAFLARLAPVEVMGWHGAASRLIGVLLLPANGLAFAMYPVLARLHYQSPERAYELMRGALRLMALAAVPAAVGTMLFAGPLVHAVFGSGRFEGAVLNVRLLAPSVCLVYFSILIGNSLLAAGRVVTWTLVQALCLVVSAVADAPLILLFQHRLANGAAGVNVSTVFSELLMIWIAIALVPRAMLRGGLLRAILQALLAGGAMAATAMVLSRAPTIAAVAASLAAYAAVLLAIGAVHRNDLRGAVAMIRALPTPPVSDARD